MERDSLYHVYLKTGKLHYQRNLTLFQQAGLSVGQPYVLMLLLHRDNISQSELAKKIHIKPATLTVMLSKMEKTGLITRKQDENDQRVSRVSLTDKGREVCRELELIMDEMDKECFKNFTQEEKLLLRRLLLQMCSNLEEVCEDKGGCWDS